MNFDYLSNTVVLDWIKPHSRMLDLAAGSGQLVEYARGRGCNVIGLDIKPVRKGIIKHDLNKKLPFGNSVFDVVTCVDSLEHVRNVSLVFREAWRVLKPGGHFIVTVPNTKFYKNHRHISYFTEKYVLRLAEYSLFTVNARRHYACFPRTRARLRAPSGLAFHLVFRLAKP